MKTTKKYFAAMNNARCGYDFRVVAFDSLKKRNLFVKSTSFEKISAAEAHKFDAYEACCRYLETVFNDRGRITGFALFTNNGDFHSLANAK